MPIKIIPLSRLEGNLLATLSECADTGQAVIVELPDRRRIALAPLDSGEDDSLTDDLLATNAAFQDLVARSKASPSKPFVPSPRD